MSNRKPTDTFRRCSNTDATGTCMYIGPCMECYWARAQHEKQQRTQRAPRGWSTGEVR